VSKNVLGSPAQRAQAATELAHGVYTACNCEKPLVYVLWSRIKQNPTCVVPHLYPHGRSEHEDQVAAYMQWWVPC
jgi:hypothetical protein